MEINLNPSDRYNEPYVYNPLYEQRPEPREKRPRGRNHANGTCGYMGSLCSHCHDLQRDWHLQIAREIGQAYPIADGEDIGAYWRRVGGSFVDTWYEAAVVAANAEVRG
ncbi:MAG TPA: hypothetical protein VJQ82_17965 [Terriglobales bacterium]|nr:hypothetical protein [Terriglobales bacterium]